VCQECLCNICAWWQGGADNFVADFKRNQGIRQAVPARSLRIPTPWCKLYLEKTSEYHVPKVSCNTIFSLTCKWIWDQVPYRVVFYESAQVSGTETKILFLPVTYILWHPQAIQKSPQPLCRYTVIHNSYLLKNEECLHFWQSLSFHQNILLGDLKKGF